MKSNLSDIDFTNVGKGAWILLCLMLITVSFVISYPLMLLWNFALVPAVSILAEVSWLQMWGISILIALLVKPLGVAKR